jgi:hypothetical protein
MTLFIKTYKETDIFGTKWVCQPKLSAFDYQGGASDDSERVAIAKCLAKYPKYSSYFQTERKGRLY